MLNHVVVMGRLTKDPELRYTQGQVAVCSFSIAVDRDYSSGDGQQKQTDFFDVVAWRHNGEFVSKYFQKGRMIVVSGRLQARRWQDNNGNNRSTVEIVAENCYFGDSKKDQESGNSAPSQGGGYYAQHGQYGAQSVPVQTQQQFTEMDDDDDDLPF